MNKKQTTWLALSLLLLCQTTGGIRVARAGTLDQSDTDTSKGSSNVGEGNFTRKKFTLTSDIRFGYDDNPLAQPDQVRFVNANGQTVSRNVDSDGSAFSNVDVGLSYTFANPRTTLTLAADVGVTYYFDRGGRDYDINGGLTAHFTYKATPRLFLDVTSFNAYISQGDYGASNLTGFNASTAGGNAAGNTSGDVNGDYFYSSNTLSASYQLSPRLSLLSSYTIVAFAYDDEPYSNDEDRTEHYFAEEARYLVQPQLTLTLDYRLGYVEYFDVSNDSITHFALGGLDYVFNPRLKASVRAGAEFRSYLDAEGDETSPYAEVNMTYDFSQRSHLSFEGRYSIEEGDLSLNVTKANTVRLGLHYDQALTPRISVYGEFYFTHGYYATPVRTDPAIIAYAPENFNEDTFDFAAGARYAITRNVSVEVGYTHTTVTSDIDVREYDRNRYFGGIRLQF